MLTAVSENTLLISDGEVYKIIRRFSEKIEPDIKAIESELMNKRDLRKCNNRQKMSGGFSLADGRDMFCRFLSFVETCKRRSLNVRDAIISTLSSPVFSYGE